MASNADVNLAPEDLARDLKCTENFLAKLRMSGDGPPYIKVGKKIRYPRAHYEQWLGSRTFKSTSATRRSA